MTQTLMNSSVIDSNDLTVLNHAAMCDILTKNGSQVKYLGWSPTPRKDAINIAEYVLDGKTHFVATDSDGVVLFDPTTDSRSVRNGKLRSYRCYRFAPDLSKSDQPTVEVT